MHSQTPLTDALEAEYTSQQYRRMRVWKLCRQLELGQRALKDDKVELMTTLKEIQAADTFCACAGYNVEAKLRWAQAMERVNDLIARS